MGRLFSRFARGSGVRGTLFYPQFILLVCHIYKIQSPKLVPKKWANSLWREIDVEMSGSIDFEAFCDWSATHFDAVNGTILRGGARVAYAEELETRFPVQSKLSPSLKLAALDARSLKQPASAPAGAAGPFAKQPASAPAGAAGPFAECATPIGSPLRKIAHVDAQAACAA
jgi:hypothetical protein